MYYKAMGLNFGLYIDEIHGNGFVDDFAMIHFTGDVKSYRVGLHTSDDGRLYFKTWGYIHYLDEFVNMDKIKIKRA